MKTTLILVCAALLAIGVTLSPAQTTIQSNGTGGGDWDSTATWQGGVVPGTLDSVVVLVGDSVHFSSAIPESCQSLTVLGTFNVPTATDTFVVVNLLTLTAGSMYYHASYSGNLAGSSYAIDHASTVIFGSSSAGGPGNLEFGNMIIRRSSGSTAGGDLVIHGDLTIDNAGSTNTFRGARMDVGYRELTVHGNVYVNQGQWAAVDVGSDTTVCIWNIDGDVIATNPSVAGARVMPFTSANAAGLAVMNIHGDLILGQGSRFSAGSSSTRGYGTAIVNLYGNFSLTDGGYTTVNHKGPLCINFKGIGTQTVVMDTNLNFSQEPLFDTVVTTSNVVFDIGSHYWRSEDTLLGTGGGAFVVDGSLWLKDSAQLEGSPEFTVNPGAKLIIGSPDGITMLPDETHGNVQTTGVRSFNTAADYEYNSSYPQNTGDGLPSTVRVLTIDNPNGVVLTSSVAVTDTLYVLDGDLDLNGNVVDLGTTGTLSETPGNTVKGSAGTITATRTLTTPSVSDNIAGLGVSIGSAASPGVTAITRGHAPPKGAGVERWFDISPTVNSGLNADFVFRYDASELNGNDDGAMQLFKSTDGGLTWTQFAAVNDQPGHKLTASGLDGFSRWSASDSLHTLAGGEINYSVADKWNMVSLPLVVSDAAKTTLFPTATSNAYLYDNGYLTADTLQYGVGYWLKFDGAQSVPITGVPFSLDTIDVDEGWNMIGTVSDTVVIATGIEEIPPGIVASQYYGYVVGYVSETFLRPAKGYWVKTTTAGQLVLNSSPGTVPAAFPAVPPSDVGELTITDAEGNSQTLYLGTRTSPVSYELPPLPPEGVFDVRFASGKMAEVVGNAAEFPLSIQGASYPVRISWTPGIGPAVHDLGLTGGDDGSWARTLRAGGEVTLSSSVPGLAIRIGVTEALPQSYSLGKNYPNPFNPSTRFEIALPLESRVEVSIYNVLGSRVATLVAGEMAAGYHTIEWNGTTDNGSPVGSGVYILRMTAGSFSAVSRVVLMK